ncbi:hypothetical protein BT96DRAFT_998115 [Gymnopus androsaceus JB14]|uniref:NAD(P)-binding domain-containing protein n=1 Tax=Gymnopus androsaceus JB14 TaxID=1447944 RepID=A0A6A4HAR8_9AGAR|nr:hypothetical protein BT96DRAFT_998115 [Gymnopus androsaceus JB14]
MNVLAIGASKNIGYYSVLRLLDAKCNVTFMLRSPSVFDSDEIIQSYVRSGQAHLIKGNALVESDMKRAWDEALTHGVVDLVFSSIGASLKDSSFSLRKGIIISPANLVTQAVLNILCTMPTQSPKPKIVTISSGGLTHSGHAALPLLLKPLYATMGIPHKDKLGAERAIAYCAGWKWDTETDGPGDDFMGEGWMEREGLPAAGTLKGVLVIRPAFLTDGDCRADSKKDAYKVQEEEIGGWTVSRKDVAHFVADAVLNRWNEFSDKIVNIGY